MSVLLSLVPIFCYQHRSHNDPLQTYVGCCHSSAPNSSVVSHFPLRKSQSSYHDLEGPMWFGFPSTSQITHHTTLPLIHSFPTTLAPHSFSNNTGVFALAVLSVWNALPRYQWGAFPYPLQVFAQMSPFWLGLTKDDIYKGTALHFLQPSPWYAWSFLLFFLYTLFLSLHKYVL